MMNVYVFVRTQGSKPAISNFVFSDQLRNCALLKVSVGMVPAPDPGAGSQPGVLQPAPESEFRQRPVMRSEPEEVDLFSLSPEQVAIYDREQRLAIANRFGIKNVDSRWGGLQIFLARIYLLFAFGYDLFKKALDAD